tara:strand:- start:343 stop:777 length:435 start_codon:yes stop_codon:yes gene_type:complete
MEREYLMSNEVTTEDITRGYGDLGRDEVVELVEKGDWSIQKNVHGVLVVRDERGHVVKGSGFPTNKINENMKLLRGQLMDEIMDSGHADLWYRKVMEAVSRADVQALTLWRDTFLGKPSEIQEEVNTKDIVDELLRVQRIIDVS